MKALVLSALLFRAVSAQDETQVITPGVNDFEPTQAGSIVEINVDNGSTLPPGASFSDPIATSAPLGVSSVLAVPTLDAAIPPGSNDVVIPAPTLPVDIPASSALGGARFGLSVEPVSRSLLGIGNVLLPTTTPKIVPLRPAPILAPGPKFPVQGPFAGSALPTTTSKAKSGGFSGLSVDEGDPQTPEDGSDPNADPGSESGPVDGQSETPADESGSTPAEDQPVDEPPVDEQPTDTEPVDEQPAETQPAEEQPVETSPSEDQPVDDQPTDTQPAEDLPTETPPTDDQPVDEPTETQPADEQPTDEPTETQPALIPNDDSAIPPDSEPTNDLGSSPIDDGGATPTDEPVEDVPTETPSDTPSDEPGTDEGSPTESPGSDDSSPLPTDDPSSEEPVKNIVDEPSSGTPIEDPEPNPAGDPQPLPEDDGEPTPEEGGNPFAGGGDGDGKKKKPGTRPGTKKPGKKPGNKPKPGTWPGGKPGTWTGGKPGSWSNEPWTGGKPNPGGNKGPMPLPIGPSGWENEDNGLYDGEDDGHGPSKGHGQGKKPWGTGGNGQPGSGYETDDDECPHWCWDDDSSPVETGTSSPLETETSSSEPWPTGGYKRKHKRKKSTKASTHRIAVSVDDNVIYDSNYARRDAADTPSSGGFRDFDWPTKHIGSDPNSVVLPANSIDHGMKGKGQGKGPSPYGHPYPYEETTDHPYDSQFDQNTDYDDKDQDKLPQWLIDLQSGNKGKSGKKKHKGKCPKTCTRKPYSTTSTWSSEPTSSEDEPTTTDEPTMPPPTTLITITSDDNPHVPSTDDYPPKPTPTGKGGLPAGYVTSGDTWTGTTLKNLCPKQCNPFNPAENFCDSQSTGCTTTGGSKYYCACRAGYKLSKAADKDFSQQFKVPGQPYVYTWPGAKCDELCDDPLCNEVMLRAVCV